MYQRGHFEMIFERDIRSGLKWQELLPELDGTSEKTSESAIVTGVRKYVVLLKPIFLTDIGIYKRTFTFLQC